MQFGLFSALSPRSLRLSGECVVKT
jgi:hypothetical protein